MWSCRKLYKFCTLIPGSNACFGIMFYVPLCYIQIQAEQDVFSLIFFEPRFCHL